MASKSTPRASTLPASLPFVVDSWGDPSAHDKPHFLTHAHADHTDGIEASAADVYCSELTRQLLLVRKPAAFEQNTFYVLSVGERVELQYKGLRMFVTPLDANHIAGALMFLFSGPFGSLLHTGDARLTPDVVAAVRAALRDDPLHDQRLDGDDEAGGNGSNGEHVGRAGRQGSACSRGDRGAAGGGLAAGGATHEALDLIYLDCTFADLPAELPTREEAVAQAARLIRGRMAAAAGQALGRVYLAADQLGAEALVRMVHDEFKEALYVPPPEQYLDYGFDNAAKAVRRRRELELLLPGVRLSDDAACRFHLVGVRSFVHRGSGGDGGSGGAGGEGGGGGGLSPLERVLAEAPNDDNDDDDDSSGGGGDGGALPAVARASPADLFLRPSAQWLCKRVRESYGSQKQMLAARVALPAPTEAVAERGVHYVLFSSHSSRSELAAALAALRPRAMRPISLDQVGRVADVVAEHAGPERWEDVEAAMARRMHEAASRPDIWASPAKPTFRARPTWTLLRDTGTCNATAVCAALAAEEAAIQQAADTQQQQQLLLQLGPGGSIACGRKRARSPGCLVPRPCAGLLRTGTAGIIKRLLAAAPCAAATARHTNGGRLGLATGVAATSGQTVDPNCRFPVHRKLSIFCRLDRHPSCSTQGQVAVSQLQVPAAAGEGSVRPSDVSACSPFGAMVVPHASAPGGSAAAAAASGDENDCCGGSRGGGQAAAGCGSGVSGQGHAGSLSLLAHVLSVLGGDDDDN